MTSWCEHAGVGEAPVTFRSSHVPLCAGAVALRPAEVRRTGKDGHPYSHVEVLFGKPVQGPVVIGRGRQFGLGLLAPLSDPWSPDGEGAVK